MKTILACAIACLIYVLLVGACIAALYPDRQGATAVVDRVSVGMAFNPYTYDYYASVDGSDVRIYVGKGKACPPYSRDNYAGPNGYCYPG